MKIAIIGAGAIGCVAGALLHEKGHAVTLVSRDPRQVRSINRESLSIDGIAGERNFVIYAARSLEFIPDLALIAVKTQDMESACRQVAGMGDSPVLTMQNGLMADDIAGSILGGERIVSSVVMFGATYKEPGHVTYNFPGGLIIGKAFGQDTGGIVDKVKDILSAAFEVRVAGNIQAMHRAKLMLNLNNAIACILGKNIQETFSDEKVCALGLSMMCEAWDVFETGNAEMADLPDLPLEKLKSLLYAPREVGSKIYGNIMRGLSHLPLPGSVLQSVMRGRNSEVDYLNGEVVREANRIGREARLNLKAVELVKEIEKTSKYLSVDEMFRRFGL
ncbi:MAG: ketopantoate reductase family protein [Nitrospirota bacterium]